MNTQLSHFQNDINRMTCTASDIILANDTKEYTLISTYLQEGLLLDKNLNSPSRICWQLLFNRARFNENLEVTISYSDMAKILDKSLRSCMRYVKLLKEKGYLEVISNRDGDIHFPNTYLIRVPQAMIDEISIHKDRRSSFYSPWASDSFVSTPYVRDEGQDNNIKLNTNNNWESLEIFEPEPSSLDVVDFKRDEDNLPNQEFQASIQELEALKANYELEDKKLTDIMLKAPKMANIPSRLEQYHFERRQQEAILAQIHLDILHLESHLTKLKKNLTPVIAAKDNLGDRKLTEPQAKRLMEALYRLYPLEALAYVFDEIQEVIAHGSLRYQKDTKTLLPVEKAVNIVLLLIRQGRWVRPDKNKVLN